MLSKRRLLMTYTMLIALCLMCLLWAFCVGTKPLSISEIMKLCIARFSGMPATSDDAILFGLRLPRALLALSVGAALSISGACMQGIFQNPMADPHILGVSSGAALGASIGILFGFTSAAFGLSAIALFALAGGLASVAVVLVLSTSQRSTLSLLLAGVAVSAFLTSLITGLMVFNRERMDQVVLWTMGSFATSNWQKVALCVPVTLLCGLGMMYFARDLNTMLLGEEEAIQLGVDVRRTRRITLLLSTICAACSVSVSGIIGFVGLMIPHALRRLIGPDHRALLPCSALLGAAFMLAMDTLARTIRPPTEMPVGALTAFVGGPFFLYLLKRRQRR